MKTSNKKGSNFPVLNKEHQDSSLEEEADATLISHEYLVEVKEKSHESESNSESDMDEEERTSTEDKEMAGDEDDYEGFAFLQKVYYVLFKTS